MTFDVGDEGFGRLVTSPPYPNAYEYWLYHKYRMYWLGFDPIPIRENEIGARPHYFKTNHQDETDENNEPGDETECCQPRIAVTNCRSCLSMHD